MSNSATPGWYHAQGDPPGTERFWDGVAWTEGPRPVGGVPPMPAADAPGSAMPATEMPATDMPAMETPSGFSTETPGIETPNPGMQTPDLQTPDFQNPAAGTGSFGAQAPDVPQDAYGMPAAGIPPIGMPATGAMPPTAMPPTGMPPTGMPGGFPGAPAGGVGGSAFYAEESKATTALVVAIVGALLCGPVSIIGGLMGNSERKAIAQGRRDPAGKGKATAALVIGTIMAILTLLVVLAIVAVLFLGSTTP